MGWAPTIFFTGLWIIICGHLNLAWHFLFGFSFQLLLDKAPLSFDWIWDTIFPLGFLTTSIRHPAISASRTRLTSTTTRSQFRGQKYCLSVCIALALALGQFSLHCSASAGGEGFVVGMRNEGTESYSVKAHAEEPHVVFAPNQATRRSSGTGKRSFQRAQRRASQHGYTWWRGKLFSAKQLGTQTTGIEDIHPHPPNAIPKGRKLRHRLTCFCWNSGGLGADKWDMFQLWLQQQQIAVVCLQETKWPFTTEWTQQHYHVVHSGSGGPSAGLMCMISKQLCSSDDLSWHDPIPGRVLHVRVHGTHRSLDILNIYQHIHSPHRMDDRTAVWQQLSTVLDNLPRRNTVLLMGDLNTSLLRRSAAVGLDNYVMDLGRSRGPQHSDAHLLMNVLTTYSLTALNTWTVDLGPTYQFPSQTQHSRIDYICCRQHMADATSKQVVYLHDFPLLCTEGSFHVPLMTSILKVWHHSTSSRPMGWTRTQRLDLCHQWQHPTSRCPIFARSHSTES